MNRLWLRLILFLIFIPTANAGETLTLRPSAWAIPVSASFNLFQVTPQLYRSAQIQAIDVKLLQTMRIRTIISLRAFHADNAILSNSGIALQRIAFFTWDIDDREVIHALRAINQALKQGAVLVHCQHGADRTGLMIAMYRILYQSWSKEQAIDELINGEYGYHSLWKNIPDYLRRVDIQRMRAAIEAN